MDVEQTLVEAIGIWKRYGREWILRDVSLSAALGQVVALVGPNGSGKTTLLRLLATLIRPQRGEVRLFGRSAKALEPLRGGMVLAADPPAFYRHLSGEENLMQTLTFMQIRADRAAVLNTLGELGLPRTRLVSAYSSGMKKRLSLARIRLIKPRLLLLDEPETALDQAGRTVLRQVIKEIAEFGTVIFATHDAAITRMLATETYTLGMK